MVFINFDQCETDVFRIIIVVFISFLQIQSIDACTITTIWLFINLDPTDMHTFMNEIPKVLISPDPRTVQIDVPEHEMGKAYTPVIFKEVYFAVIHLKTENVIAFVFFIEKESFFLYL